MSCVKELEDRLASANARIDDLKLACDMGLAVVDHLRLGRTEWPETYLEMVFYRMEKALKGNDRCWYLQEKPDSGSTLATTSF